MLLWAAEDRLAAPAREAIAMAADAVFVSAATIWEIEIKVALGRLRVPGDIVQQLDDSGFERLPITFEHARETGRLPLLHGDPFDRMLIAQARLEGMMLATADATIRRYEVPVLAVGAAEG